MRKIGNILLLCSIFATLVACGRTPEESACSRIEWEIQNAAQCLAKPHMWKEWSEIRKSYGSDPTKGVGEIGCPIFISKMEYYGFFGKNVALIDYFTKTYGEKGGVAHRFKKVTGRDFCEVAQEEGWVSKNLEMNQKLR